MLSALRHRGFYQRGVSYEDECRLLVLDTLSARRAMSNDIFKTMNGATDINVTRIGLRAPDIRNRSRGTPLFKFDGDLAPLERCVKLLNMVSHNRDIDEFNMSKNSICD